jgi:hypothetical protein
MNNRDPFVFKTTDYGRTWRSVSSDIPRSLFSYAHCVREDPVMRGLLYLGTENGVYFSRDDGQHWLPLQAGLPHAPAHWLTIQEHFNDLVVATYGRGFWILDDITPLRTMTAATLNDSAHLFAPRPAYRFRNITDPMMMPDDASEGRNAPYGADLTFSLKETPRDDARAQVKLVINDAAGKTVKTIDAGKEAAAGINRIWWDLRMDATEEITLRTRPLHAPDFALSADGTRKFPTPGSLSPLVPPGTYSVKLVAGGVERTESLVVRKDPNTAGSEEDVAAQTVAMRAVRDNVNSVAHTINAAESVRAQLATWRALMVKREDTRDLNAAADALDKQILDVESRLFNTTATGRGQDFLRTPNQLVDKLVHLADVVSYADFAPTESQLQVGTKLTQEAAQAREQMDGILMRVLATFNATLRDRQLGAIVVPKP